MFFPTIHGHQRHLSLQVLALLLLLLLIAACWNALHQPAT
jgi:hypothetical protein